MIIWLLSNAGTIFVSMVLFGTVAAILRKMIRDKKAGIHACSCGCSGCGGCSACHGSCAGSCTSGKSTPSEM